MELPVKGKRSLSASFVRCLRKRKKSVSLCMDPYGSPGWQAIDNDKVPSVKKLFWKKTGAAGGFRCTAVSKWHVCHIRGPWMPAGKRDLTHTSFLTQLDNKSGESIMIISGILAVILNINSCVKLVISTSNIFQEQHILSAGSIIKITGLSVVGGWFNTYCMWGKKKKSHYPANQYLTYSFWMHFCQIFL